MPAVPKFSPTPSLLPVYRRKFQSARKNETLHKIGERARKAGCSVKASISPKGHLRVSTLHIGQKACAIHLVTKAWKPQQRYYACASVRPSRLAACPIQIFRVAVPPFPERMFVVPSSLLRKSGADDLKKIYLPLEHQANPRSSIDYWKYEEAWHLLKTDK